MNFDNPAMRMSLHDVLAHQARLKAGKEPPSDGVEDESALHLDIIAELKRRGWYFVHSRMDRSTTQQKGVPDFIIAAPGKTYWVEAKARGKKPTPEQLGAIQWLGSLKHQAAVVRSMDEFLALIAGNGAAPATAASAAPLEATDTLAPRVRGAKF